MQGLSVAAQYEGKNDRAASQSDAVRRSNGDGYAASLQYSFDFGLSLVGAYANINRTAIQNTALRGRGEKAELWAGGIKYDANQIYLASIYGENHNATPIAGGFANKATNFEMIAQYQFLNGLRPSIAYISSRANDIEKLGSAYLYKYISAGAVYYFNKNMNVYAEYKVNLLNANNKLGLANDDISAVGLTYQF